MRRGARSIRGALGTYAWVTVASMAVFAFVLWLGPCHGPPPSRVTLAEGRGWIGATIDDGRRLWELEPTEALELAPGSYRITLFAESGDARRGSLELDGTPVALDAGVLGPPGAEAALDEGAVDEGAADGAAVDEGGVDAGVSAPAR